jgi:hypothetical protein
MSKKRWKEEQQHIDEVPEPEEPPESAEMSALKEVYRMASTMNGHDHMKLCAFYVTGSDHCDCGLQLVRQAVSYCRSIIDA